MRRKRRSRPLLAVVEILENRALLTGASSADLMVGFQSGASAQNVSAALQALDARVLQTFPSGDKLVQPGPSVNVTAAVGRVERMAGVRFVEQDTAVKASAVVPNDPQFTRQWGLDNPVTGVDINAENAWPVTTGNPSNIVAIIDSGIDLNNPDFSGRLWTNPGEVPGNGLDDDHDGYADDVHGWNFLNGNNDLSDDDTDSHGTHVSGIVGANGNDGYGVAGVDWNARLMVLKFIGPDGTGDVSSAIQAIYYAVQNGARVINASWGQPDGSQALYDAVQYAGLQGAVFVMAAGNGASDDDFSYPYASLDQLSNVILVANVDSSGNLEPSSNYGANSVDIAAPGTNIRSDVKGGFANLTGTSMSAAFVSGVASLVVGLHPEDSAAQVVQAVVSTATPLPGLRGLVASGGIVNAAAALSVAPSAPVFTTGTPSMSADQANALILGSDEYYAHHGGTDVGFVSGLYQDILGRSPSTGDLELWVGWLRSGHSRSETASAIEASSEAAVTKVARWFQTDLGWTTPLPQLKAIGGVSALAGLLLQGASDSQVRAYILSQQGGDPASFIRLSYQAALGRPATNSEVSAWQSVLASGVSRQTAALGILESPEARAYQAASWYHNELGRNLPVAVLKTDPGVLVWAGLVQG